MSIVNFPLIINYSRAFKDSHDVYFLVEYIKGMELFDVIRDIGNYLFTVFNFIFTIFKKKFSIKDYKVTIFIIFTFNNISIQGLLNTYDS